MKIKAFVFDFDGIITDTEPVHMDAWLGVLEPLGISFDETEFRASYLGLNDYDFLDAVGRIHGHHFSGGDKDDMIAEKLKFTIASLEHDVPLISGVSEFVSEAAKSYMLSICSGADKQEIEFILRHLGWREHFDPIISGGSVTKGKPDPEGYIRAFEGLVERADSALLPENVVAIEDSPKGIRAAKAAGLRCLAVSNSFGRGKLTDADWVVDSLALVDVADLESGAFIA